MTEPRWIISSALHPHGRVVETECSRRGISSAQVRLRFYGSQADRGHRNWIGKQKKTLQRMKTGGEHGDYRFTHLYGPA